MIISNIDLKNNKISKKLFHSSRILRSPELGSMALIAGKYATMSANQFLILCFISVVIVGQGIHIYNIGDEIVSNVQYTELFPDEYVQPEGNIPEGEGEANFYVPAEITLEMLEYVRTITEGTIFLSNHFGEFTQFELNLFINEIDRGIEQLITIDNRLVHLLQDLHNTYDYSHDSFRRISLMATSIYEMIPYLRYAKSCAMGYLNVMEFGSPFGSPPPI